MLKLVRADALAQRVADCKTKVVLTASQGMRGKTPIPLKQIVDLILKLASVSVCQLLCARRCPGATSG